MTGPDLAGLPRHQRPMATVVAVGTFAVLCLLGLVFGLRGLFAPFGSGPAGSPEPAAATSPNTGDRQPQPAASRRSAGPGPGPAEGATFSSPTGNIRCALTTEDARCDISDRAWQPPARPASCALTWGKGLRVTATSAQPVCAGGRVTGGAPLAYGRSVASGDFRCSSGRDGVTCQHRPSGHGFTISRTGYTMR